MEEIFQTVSHTIALLIEAGAALIIVVAAVEAIIGAFRAIFQKGQPDYREVYLRFGSRLILGLEFALAADIVRTSIAPSWNDIGQLAAIATIRTFLNYFLERDIEKFAAEERAHPDKKAGRRGIEGERPDND